MDESMTAAFELSAHGMGTVFVFLAILVVATTVMSNLVGKFAPPAPAKPPAPKRSAAKTGPDPKVRKAIELAVARYRAEH